MPRTRTTPDFNTHSVLGRETALQQGNMEEIIKLVRIELLVLSMSVLKQGL